MSKSESRRTQHQALVRMSAEQWAFITEAIVKSLREAPGFVTTSVPRFVLAAALEKASGILGRPVLAPRPVSPEIAAALDEALGQGKRPRRR
jgi:hypothetical protein